MRVLITLLALALIPSMLPAQQPSPGTILHDADSACATVATAMYRAHIEYLGIDGVTTVIDETIALKRAPGAARSQPSVRIATDNGYLFTSDGANMLAISPTSKKLFRYDSSFSTLGYIRDELSGFPLAYLFARESPFSQDAGQFVYEGDTTILGISCRTLRESQPDVNEITQRSEQWSFGREDHLPRCLKSSAVLNGSPFSTTITLSEFRLNIPLADSLFTIPFLAGYDRDTVHLPTRTKGLDVGTVAPGWTLNDMEGRPVSLDDLGGRVLVLDFWYLGCPPCQKALPMLENIRRRYDTAQVAVIGIDGFDEIEPVARFVKAKGVSCRLLFDKGAAAKTYKVQGYPTLILIGKDGRILWSHRGYSDGMEDDLDRQIQAALR